MVVTKTSLNDLSCWNANLPETSCYTDFVLACCYLPFCSDGSEKALSPFFCAWKVYHLIFSYSHAGRFQHWRTTRDPPVWYSCPALWRPFPMNFLRPAWKLLKPAIPIDRQLNQTITTWSKYMQSSFKRRRASQATLSWFQFTYDFMKYGAESLSVCSHTKPQSHSEHSQKPLPYLQW